MRKTKTVTKGKYTLYFEDCSDNIECIAFETGDHMSMEDIGNVLGISRVCVRNNLKRSVEKIYKRMKAKNIQPFDIACSMTSLFNINSDAKIKQFLRLFPENIRSEINRDARRAV